MISSPNVMFETELNRKRKIEPETDRETVKVHGKIKIRGNKEYKKLKLVSLKY